MSRTGTFARSIMAVFMMCIMIVLPMSFASAMTITPGNNTLDKFSAVISWQTDNNSTSRINYGNSSSRLNQERIAWQYVTQHSILLTGLKENTTYYYYLTAVNPTGSDRAVNNNSNNYFTFTTLPDLLVINVTSIPEYTNKPTVNVIGTVNPSTDMKVYVNTELRAGSRIADTTFNFYDIPLRPGENRVKIWAQYKTQIVEKQFIVNYDSAQPAVHVKIDNKAVTQLPSNYGKKSMVISGDVDKPVNVEFIVNGVSSVMNISTAVTNGTAASTTNFTRTLTLNDGDNDVIIRFMDRAGNSVIMQGTVNVDSLEPQIIDSNLKQLSPSYTNFVTVKGTVNKPYADIVIFVNGRTTNSEFFTTSLGDWVRHIYRTDIEGEQLDYHTRADSLGNFSVDIELTREIVVTDAAVGLGGEDTSEGRAWRNNITIMLIDPVGRNATKMDSILYATCGTGGDWYIKWNTPSPNVLQEQVLRSDSGGMFTFTLDAQYVGSGNPEKAQIKVADMRFRTDFTKEQADIYRLEKSLIKGGKPKVTINKRTNKMYVVMQLNQLTLNLTPYKDWKDMEDKLTFPFLLQIDYDYYDPFEDKQITRTQKECNLYTIAIEKSIPPDKMVNEKLLTNLMSGIETTKKIFAAVQKTLGKLMMPLTLTCFASWILRYFWNGLATKYL